MAKRSASEPEGSKASFGTRAQIDLVYAAALRLTQQDTNKAADITQAVMLVTIRKAQTGKLPPEKHMGGWLIKVTRYAAMQAHRAAARRSRHECTAARARVTSSDESALDQDVRSALDESLMALGTMDREVVIRRYLQGQSVSEIGNALGMPENTIGRRILRAIPKLRAILHKRGISAPTAAISTVLAAEFAVKAPPSYGLAMPVPSSVMQLAKQLSWRIVIMKLKFSALVGLAALLIAGMGVAAFFAQRQSIATGPATNKARDEFPSTMPGISVSRVIDEPSDAILKELLAGLQENKAKLQMIHVRSICLSRMHDLQLQTWGEPGRCEGEAWLEAAATRRFRAEVTSDESLVVNGAGTAAPSSQASYTETWDGKESLRLFGPPFSSEAGNAFANQRYLKAALLAGAEFSMQLAWDEESATDANGSHKTINRNPLDQAVLAGMKLSARRVLLVNGLTAMELTVNIPDIGVGRVETFWFDPARGYGMVARRNTLSLQDREIRRQTVVVESLIEASPGIFYPGKAEMLWEEQGSPFMWQSFVASDVKANETPATTTFTLTFPRGIPVYDFNGGIGKKREPSITPE